MPGTQPQIANDRFKQRSAHNVWGGLVVAVTAHALLFVLAPAMRITDLRVAADEVMVVKAEPPVPEPPEVDEIQEPGPPIFGDFLDDVTMAANTDLYDTRGALPGPPPVDRRERTAIDAFMPRDVNPVLRNMREVQGLLERGYPLLLRDAGIGGTVQVWFYIDEQGIVRDTRLNASSGYDALDRVALDIAASMEFSPALLNTRPVPVWVSIPIVFSAR